VRGAKLAAMDLSKAVALTAAILVVLLSAGYTLAESDSAPQPGVVAAAR
jgi:hypothetical protein